MGLLRVSDTFEINFAAHKPSYLPHTNTSNQVRPHIDPTDTAFQAFAR
jgi:hypothetical protein